MTSRGFRAFAVIFALPVFYLATNLSGDLKYIICVVCPCDLLSVAGCYLGLRVFVLKVFWVISLLRVARALMLKMFYPLS